METRETVLLAEILAQLQALRLLMQCQYEQSLKAMQVLKSINPEVK
jgi:hypothetical protein